MTINNDVNALEACCHYDNLFMMIYWPESYLYSDIQIKAIDIISGKGLVVYTKELLLTKECIRNLVAQINDLRNKVGGGEIHIKRIWNDIGICKFILIQTSSIKDVQSLLYEKNSLGRHLVDVSNTTRETRIIANSIYNPNSLHFLFNARPFRYKSAYRRLEIFRKLLEDNSRDKNDYIIDSSMVLAVYGIRSAADLDYYSIDPCGRKFINTDRIEEHNDIQKSYYDGKIEDLILSPHNYFVFNELKFVSLEKLIEFKRRRYNDCHDSKDKYDIILIKMLLENDNDVLKKLMILGNISFKRKVMIILNMLKGILVFLNLYGLCKKVNN